MSIIHTAFFDVVFVAPEFVCDDKFAELRAPVAKVIYADRAVAQEVERAIKRRADDRRHKMADMERFCDVDGRIVDADGSCCSTSRGGGWWDRRG